MVHQFEKITIWKTLVTATPWNFDYLLNKNHLLLLVTVTKCDHCEEANEVFVDMRIGLFMIRVLWQNEV